MRTTGQMSKPVGTRTCMSQSVEGPLMNWTVRDWRDATRWIERTDGEQWNSWRELKQYFLQLLADGWRVIPCGDYDNFDKEKGCLGHPPRTDQ